MNFKKKLLIFIISIVIVLIIVVMFMLLYLNKNKQTENSKLEEQEQKYINSVKNSVSILNGKKPELIQYETVYLTVKDSIRKFLEIFIENDENAIKSILDKQYLKEKDNVTEISNFQIKQIESLYIENMYELSGNQYNEFYVKVYIDDIDFYIQINQDTKNKTFSIIILNKETFNKKINTEVEDRTGQEQEIEKNEYNEYTPVILKEEGIAQAYFNDVKETMLLHPNKVYEKLDAEYRRKRFPNYEEFENYIKNNKEKIQSSIATKYLLNTENGNKQYICIDNNQNTYTFNISSAMKYTILLDNYTIEDEEFKNDYNKLSEKDKVSTNIDKFIKCINYKDYIQAYNFLDEGFKNNYFKTVKEFEEYIVNNFYDNNFVKNLEINNEGNIFICTLNIKSGLGAGAASTQKKINMKLKEDTDFVMSFNIE